MKEMQDITYRRYGATVEYRLIIVKNNEIAGVYKYNSQPCPDGCEINSFNFSSKNPKQSLLKDAVSGDALEEFIQYSIHKLVTSIKTSE